MNMGVKGFLTPLLARFDVHFIPICDEAWDEIHRGPEMLYSLSFMRIHGSIDLEVWDMGLKHHLWANSGCLSTKVWTLRDYHAWGHNIYDCMEQIWPQKWVWVYTWHGLAKSEEQTRRVAWSLPVTTQRVVLSSWGVDSGCQGESGWAESSRNSPSCSWDLAIWFVVAPRFMLGGTRRVREVLDVSREDPKESVDTYRLAESP